MIKLVFVGDNPSSFNISPDIAFVGSKCFSILVKWIKKLNPDFYTCLNSDTISQLNDINLLYKNGFKVIALGNKASKRLEKFGVQHIKMPHPSGLNRINNDKNLIEKELTKVQNYINTEEYKEIIN